MLILGIESSCDETGASIISAGKNSKKVKLLSNVVASSIALHAKSGGIIPENAAREQVKFIIPVIKKVIDEMSESLTAGHEGLLNDRARTGVFIEKERRRRSLQFNPKLSQGNR